MTDAPPTPPPTPQPLRVAVAQVPVTGDLRRNGAVVRTALAEAAAAGARLVVLPEGLLSGYALNPVTDWTQVDFGVVADELALVAADAAEHGLWVVLGSAHPSERADRPFNSLHVISDAGEVVARYDKRLLSHTESTRFYSPGRAPVVVEVDGFRLGLLTCIEVNFPRLLEEYAALGVDAVVLSAYPVDEVFAVKAQAWAGLHCVWLVTAYPADTAGFIASAVDGPDGRPVAVLDGAEGLLVADLDPTDPAYDVALTKARPWRAAAWAAHLARVS